MMEMKNFAQGMAADEIRKKLEGLTLIQLQQLARETGTPIPRDKRRKADIIEIFVMKYAIAEEASTVEDTPEVEEKVTNKETAEMYHSESSGFKVPTTVMVGAAAGLLCSVGFCKLEAIPLMLSLSSSLLAFAAMADVATSPEEELDSKVAEVLAIASGMIQYFSRETFIRLVLIQCSRISAGIARKVRDFKNAVSIIFTGKRVFGDILA